MITNFKIFEESSFYLKDDDIKVGDVIYCINNKGVERDLEMGGKYTIDKICSYNPTIFRLTETQSRWMGFRFSLDPNHINIAKYNSNKFNL